ncbi:MAG: APC family permease [Saccharolobus sp.]|uniref:APC family permease n=1 Tax=Saccharolobus sp. TaxID=2100761 RepID=UPI0028CF484C|nr:APC family permease [Saccharolobus sp.]MDT7862575.1 APC family permease [Saccharolobus sp.]
MNRRKLSAFEAFSLSFGGQAPFTSIITFGTVGLQLGGSFLVLATLIGTILVLLNGLVIYRLSLRYSEQGGYFTYAFYSLTQRLGLLTGWIFILYAFAYGGTLLAGSIYIITNYIKLPFLTSDIFTLAIIIFSSFLIIRGLEISVKYAEIISVAEILAIAISSYVLLANVHVPFKLNVPAEPFLVILYAIGMPIGYGNLNPMSEDIKNARKIVGIITVIVILLGGLLSALLFYASSFYGSDLIEILRNNVGFMFPYLVFSALNGGILGGIAYIIAMSRIIYSMSLRRFIPVIFSLLRYNRPFNAELFSLAIYSIFLFLSIHFYGVYSTFLVLGGITVLSYLVISLSANLSLFRITLKKIRKRKQEMGLSVISSVLSIIILIYSIRENVPIVNYVFFSWIIGGFIYAEILEMIGQYEDDKD